MRPCTYNNSLWAAVKLTTTLTVRFAAHTTDVAALNLFLRVCLMLSGAGTTSDAAEQGPALNFALLHLEAARRTPIDALRHLIADVNR